MADRLDLFAAFHQRPLGGLYLAPVVLRRLRDQKALPI
jgi:hypothetical protein